MRQKKSAMPTLLFFSALLFFQVNAVAKKIEGTSYHYPYKDPYLATATVALMQGTENPPTSEIEDLRLKVLDQRDDIYLLEGMGELRYRFYRRKGPAPLIFIIPGLAGSAYSGTARFLAEWLADNGFHALILPSRFNWNFTLAASTSGYPGYIQEDTRDLYSLMQLVLADIKIHCHPQIGKIGKIGMLGVSDGALYTAYISKMDSEKKQIGIETFLLVNPPVDLFEAARKIDRMADIGKDYSNDQKSYLEAYSFGVLSEALRKNIGDPNYFADWDKRLRLTDRQIAYLIGNNVHKSVGDSIYVIGLVNDLAVLKTPISWGYRSRRLEEARSFALMDYVRTFLIPRLRRIGNKKINLEALDNQNSIRGIMSELKNNQRVFLMHNLDDILVSAEDIAYLEKIFGERAMVYPHGGHLGNLWYLENKKHIVEVFKPLLQGVTQSNLQRF